MSRVPSPRTQLLISRSSEIRLIPWRKKVPRTTISRTLPWEIVLDIVEAISPSHLLSFIRTCKALRVVAEPLLYRDIRLSNCPRRSIHFFCTMINRPELGRHVLTFQAADRFPFLSPSNITRVLRHWRGGPAFWITRPMTYRSMAERTIQHLVNVKALSFHGTTPASIGRLAGHHSITKVRLVHPTLMTELESLLDALPLVTHLTLPFNTVGPPEAGAIHTDHVPNLESLICSTDAVGLVAGRPIRELYIMFPMRWDPPPSVHTIMEKVSQSTVPLRVLGIAIEWIWTFGEDYSEVLTAAARVLPDLEELHLAFGFFPGQAQFVQNIFEVVSICFTVSSPTISDASLSLSFPRPSSPSNVFILSPGPEAPVPTPTGSPLIRIRPPKPSSPFSKAGAEDAQASIKWSSLTTLSGNRPKLRENGSTPGFNPKSSLGRGSPGAV